MKGFVCTQYQNYRNTKKVFFLFCKCGHSYVKSNDFDKDNNDDDGDGNGSDVDVDKTIKCVDVDHTSNFFLASVNFYRFNAKKL